MTSRPVPVLLNDRTARFQEFRLSTHAPTLLGDTESETDSVLAYGSQPEWHDIVMNVRTSFNVLMREIQTLQQDQGQSLQSRFDDENEPLMAVDRKSKIIARKLQETHNTILRLSKNAYSTPYPTENSVVVKHVQSKLEIEVKLIIGVFREVQNGFAARLRERDERLQRFTIEAEQDYDNIEEEEGVVAVHEAISQSRRADIQQIVQSMNELGEMTKEMAAMVAEQGTLLDRIDYNMDITAEQVDKGVSDLRKANKHQKRGWIFQVIIWGLMIAAFGQLIVYVLRVNV